MEKGVAPVDSKFTRLLLEHYSVEELFGKAIKDKRGGENNIHSWDIELKGPVSKSQKALLSVMMTERRKKNGLMNMALTGWTVCRLPLI